MDAIVDNAFWVSLILNALLGILGFLSRKAYLALEEKLTATVTSIDEVRNKLHVVEIELPKTYATKQELLQARQETTDVLNEVRSDIKKILGAVGIHDRAA